MNTKYVAWLENVLPFIGFLRDFIALPMANMLIATLCIVAILLVGTFCWTVINKKNSLD